MRDRNEIHRALADFAEAVLDAIVVVTLVTIGVLALAAAVFLAGFDAWAIRTGVALLAAA